MKAKTGNWCSDCYKEYCSNWTKQWREKNKERLAKEQSDRYQNDPEFRKKADARNRAWHANKDKQPCSRCGATENVEMHHEDYNQPTEVVWFCKDCHTLHHLEEH